MTQLGTHHIAEEPSPISLLPVVIMALPEPPIYPDLKGKVVLVTGIGQQGDPDMVGNIGLDSSDRMRQPNSTLFRSPSSIIAKSSSPTVYEF